MCQLCGRDFEDGDTTAMWGVEYVHRGCLMDWQALDATWQDTMEER